MAYKDFPSARDKLAMEFYKLKYRQLSDEQKEDVKQGLKDNYNLRNQNNPNIHRIEKQLKKIAGFKNGI